MASKKFSAIAAAGAITGPNTIIGVQAGTTDVQYTVTNMAAAIAAAVGLAITSGKIFTVSNTITLAGADGASVTVPTTGTLATLAGSEALTNKTYNGNTWTAGTGVLTLGALKTLTVSNTLTFTGTDSSSVAFGAGGTVLYANQSITLSGDVTGSGTTAITTVLATAQPAVHTWALAQTFTVAPVFTDASGSRTALGLGTAATQNTGTSGANVPLLNAANTWASGQVFVAPVLGTPASGVVTNLTGTASININGTVGASSPTTGSFSSLQVTAGNFIAFGAAPGGTTYAFSGGVNDTYINSPGSGGHIGIYNQNTTLIMDIIASSVSIPISTASSAYTNGSVVIGGGMGVAGNINTNGNITQTAGRVLSIASGTNQRAGDLTLVGGTKAVANTTVTANTRVFLTRKTSGGTIGVGITYTLSAGVSFTVNSDNALDTSTFSFLLVEVP